MTPSIEGDRDEFVLALLYPDLPPPASLTAWHGEQPLRRFAVYRNNLFVGLSKALEERFPVCARLVGEAFFRAMAQAYVRVSPPRTPILFEYGENFAEFISTLAPARELPYLADIARLEYAVGRAHHAADADPLSLEAMRSLSRDRLYGATLSLHPSAQLIASKYPIVSIWRANILEGDATAWELSAAQDALVLRPRLEVQVHALPPGGYAFTQALAQRRTFSSAAETAARDAKDFDLTDCLRVLLASRAIVAIHLDAREFVAETTPASPVGN